MAGLKMGWYRLDEYGTVYRLTTAARPVVYVDTAPTPAGLVLTRAYVFSPEDPERFAELLRTMAAGGRTDAAGSQNGVVFRSAPSPSVFADPLILVSLAVTLPLGLGSVYVVRKGPSTIRYEVDGDGIVVHHLGRRRYRWDSVRGVRRIDGRLSRVRRLMGAALPATTGQFTAGELGSLGVYATRLAPPLVLLETRVGKVLISPEDVDGFWRSWRSTGRRARRRRDKIWRRQTLCCWQRRTIRPRSTRCWAWSRAARVRARHVGHDIVAGLRKLVGGEISEYAKLLEETREEAIQAMVAAAEKLGANGIIGIRMTSNSITAGGPPKWWCTGRRSASKDSQ